jgi:hypothetical protein
MYFAIVSAYFVYKAFSRIALKKSLEKSNSTSFGLTRDHTLNFLDSTSNDIASEKLSLVKVKFRFLSCTQFTKSKNSKMT